LQGQKFGKDGVMRGVKVRKKFYITSLEGKDKLEDANVDGQIISILF
jgi:hypothetical protein